MAAGNQPGQLPELQYFYVEKGKDYTWQLVQHRTGNTFKPSDYINLRVYANRFNNEVMFTMSYNDRE